MNAMTTTVAAVISCVLLSGVARGDDAGNTSHRLESEPLAVAGLADLSLEQLGDIRVTTVSRRPESLSDAAASIYVITADDIRRSGATSLPEALRLAPTLDVARADANQYAISARGFDSVLANKMLVLIDGRTVYSPLFSGTFWEAQDLLLEDVDRIEVIAGPGGTMWGTNAVNGVINVITRSAAETQGVLAVAGGGNDRKIGGARWGGAVGTGLHYRGWVKYTDQDNTERADDTPVVDASKRVHGGFQADWGRPASRFTLQGGASSADIQQVPDHRELSEFHLLGRWDKVTSANGSARLQAYWDRTNRNQPASITDGLDAYDLEFQHAFRPLARHDLFWGAGYRYQADATINLSPAVFQFLPADRILRIADAFFEDGVALTKQLRLTAGVKAEHNVYTHLEWLPSLKLAWKPSRDELVWSGLSRAVRTPSRVDREFFSPGSPPFVFLDGGPDFVSEVSNVAELGWRGQPARRLSGSVTGFYHHHDRLRSFEETPTGPQFLNGIDGRSYGVEAWAKCGVSDRCRVIGGIVDQRREVSLDPGVIDLNGAATLGNDPRYWWSLGAAFDPGSRLECDATLRQVGPLPNPAVPRYTTVDARVGLRLARGLDLSVTGTNLLEPAHAEWGSAAARAVLERTVYVQLRVHDRADPRGSEMETPGK